MMVEFWEQIKKKQLASLYILYGTESFLINETCSLIIQTILGETEKQFNLSVYDCEEVPLEIALEDAETLPFFGEKRVVLIRNPYFLTAEKGKEKIEHNLKKLEAYIEQPSPFSIVIFAGNYEKLDERKKITKALIRQANVFVANPLAEPELRKWVNHYLSSSAISIREDAIDVLLQLTGMNLTLIVNELNKIMLFVGEGGIITVETVQMLVPRTLEQNIFALIDKVVQRNLNDGLRILYDLLRNNEEPIKILSMLASQFRLIYQAKGLAEKGYGQQQIASMLKVHPYRIKIALGQGKAFTENELMNIMGHLAEADYEMKSGRMDKRLILELFIVKLNQKR